MTNMQLKGVEEMMDIFLTSGVDREETVDRSKLMDHYKKAGISQDRIDEWMSRFETDSKNDITLQEFCRGINARLDEIREEMRNRVAMRDGQDAEVDDDIKIISTTANYEIQRVITNKFKELMKGHDTENEEEMKTVVNKLKEYLDQTYERVWQCVILTGSYWMHYSHEPFRTIQFQWGRYIVLAWRTPRG